MQSLLLLDLDGTIIDTPHFEAWRIVARRIEGLELSYEQYVACIAGRPRLEGASRLLALKQTPPCNAESRSSAVYALADSNSANSCGFRSRPTCMRMRGDCCYGSKWRIST